MLASRSTAGPFPFKSIFENMSVKGFEDERAAASALAACLAGSVAWRRSMIGSCSDSRDFLISDAKKQRSC